MQVSIIEEENMPPKETQTDPISLAPIPQLPRYIEKKDWKLIRLLIIIILLLIGGLVWYILSASDGKREMEDENVKQEIRIDEQKIEITKLKDNNQGLKAKIAKLKAHNDEPEPMADCVVDSDDSNRIMIIVILYLICPVVAVCIVLLAYRFIRIMIRVARKGLQLFPIYNKNILNIFTSNKMKWYIKKNITFADNPHRDIKNVSV